MPPEAKVLRDGTTGRKEPLRVARRLEPLHAALALSSGLMRVLGTVVQIPVLAMCHSWENLALGRFVAL
jgi:hypothetical protein